MPVWFTDIIAAMLELLAFARNNHAPISSAREDSMQAADAFGRLMQDEEDARGKVIGKARQKPRNCFDATRRCASAVPAM